MENVITTGHPILRPGRLPATGGRRGAIAGDFLWGFVGRFVISFAYKMQVFGDLESLGVAGLAFTVPDAIVPGIVIWLIARLFGVR